MVINRRFTPQRQIILEHLQSVKTHPTAEQVFNVVKHKFPNITLATVYRNLHILTEEKKAKKLEINGKYHFDGDLMPHLHFICENCKIIKDLFLDDLNKYLEKKLAKSNLAITKYNIQCEGICKTCT
ncbi:transcriptional repressor [Candidatus Woesearchaeota archaeon]|jgi:Fe2+ or Zn2+ uptake regulation protein|nr:transcriptional repressor [Candidatus Woesearchaeota archaeon]MBT4151368.1 transcriptional repressor [Candidatus Woesearchaeota archaeon]MBT4247766.1 transcriptional repressor [Candidatus Woesearchaeota archaeon]MBT4434190.1 transcriptional repressor [Candidatus Woesearchaeota archaeon]